MADHVELRRGVYHDSVTLMRISTAVLNTPGVEAGQVAMATELNIDITAGMGFAVPDTAGPQDLLVALRAADDDGIAAGLAGLEQALTDAEKRPVSGGFGAAPVARSVRAAAEAHPDAGIVLLSVPGSSVLPEALDALAAGRHVMIFSDNVPVEHEILLKDRAAAADLLVMGPDCGTAIIGGVGLGFANALSVSDGPGVGIVAASGTGAQQVSILLDQAGVRVSHLIGVGGRDLSDRVGARSAVRALAMLDADPGTDRLVVVSKPPHPEAARKVEAAANAAEAPAHLMLLGAERPDITASVEELLREIDVAVPSWPTWGTIPQPTTGLLRGLFAGGTLADEAMAVAGRVLGDIVSNIPLRPDLALPDSAITHGRPNLAGIGHCVVDLGDDAFTVGRGHPMIDPTVRLDLLATTAADPAVGVILLDVVLGHAAEDDPAAHLAPAIAAALARSGSPLRVVVSLCATATDPQDRERQAAALVEAGATVYLSNAEASRVAASLVAAETKGA